MKESDIIYEVAPNWFVLRQRDGYYVQRPELGSLHNLTRTDSVYDSTPGGLSIAKARLDYITRTGTLNRRG
jgi:hypothetical protein